MSGAKEDTPGRPRQVYDEGRVKQIAAICLALRKQADFFRNTEPENLANADFDRIAQELELLARSVDNLLDVSGDE